MKQVRKMQRNFLYHIGLLFILLSICFSSCINTGRNTYRVSLTKQQESEHFVFFCQDKDKNVLDSFQHQLEAGYQRIAEDIDYQMDKKVYVEIYPSVSTLHSAVGIPNMPEWVAAYTGKRGDYTAIMVVSPNNPGSHHTGEFILNRVVVHELAQSMIFGKHKKRPPIWLFKGLASYEGNNLTPEEIQPIIYEEVKAGDVPTMQELQPANDEKVPEETFNDLNGYEYSFTLVEYIVKKYGMGKVRELLDARQYPYDYQLLFGITESEFYGAWVAFLKETYIH